MSFGSKSTFRQVTFLAGFYSSTGRPSVDPELMIRMLMVGYCYGIRSERRLCEEVHLNLAYRWFCGLGLEGQVPDHSTFSKNRHGRFRESDPNPRRSLSVADFPLRPRRRGTQSRRAPVAPIAWRLSFTSLLRR
jgi:transposase-like protein DUF772